MDVEGKTIRITKAQHFEGGGNIAVMLFHFYVSYFSLRPTDRIFNNVDPAEIRILILWSSIVDIKFSSYLCLY